MLLALCAATGLDPVTQVFAWLSGTATLGALALMALTCLAVIVYFRRTGTDRRLWHTLTAPGLGLLGLAACLILAIVNFPLLIGGSTALAAALGTVLLLSFAVGAACTPRGRRRPAPETATGDPAIPEAVRTTRLRPIPARPPEPASKHEPAHRNPESARTKENPR
ncbi:hypothetical protein SUDANB6_00048 [Streptomyces sp. enrichment culture]|uniref:hypothetical protein n=1 Tax=Streptomyces sp. enrichment culture TaxID=1795815 RepID=UPI003F568244